MEGSVESVFYKKSLSSVYPVLSKWVKNASGFYNVEVDQLLQGLCGKKRATSAVKWETIIIHNS